MFDDSRSDFAGTHSHRKSPAATGRIKAKEGIDEKSIETSLFPVEYPVPAHLGPQIRLVQDANFLQLAYYGASRSSSLRQLVFQQS